MNRDEVLAALESLSDEDRRWVLNESLSDEDRRWVLNEITRKAILEMKDAMAKFREAFEQKSNRHDG